MKKAFLVTCLPAVVGHLSLVTFSIAAEPVAKGIQDNSFLVEEAYNQEPGVVQHILTVPIAFTGREKEVSPNFTQEWPVFSQLHQFSYTIPYTFVVRALLHTEVLKQREILSATKLESRLGIARISLEMLEVPNL